MHIFAYMNKLVNLSNMINRRRYVTSMSMICIYYKLGSQFIRLIFTFVCIYVCVVCSLHVYLLCLCVLFSIFTQSKHHIYIYTTELMLFILIANTALIDMQSCM